MGLLLLGAALRVIVLAQTSDAQFLSVDGLDYQEIARHLAAGHGFAVSDYRWFEPVPDDPPSHHPDLYRPPLVPLMGAMLHLLPWSWAVQARLLTILLGTGLILAVHAAGATLWRRSVGLSAAAIFAVHPYAVLYASRWSTETVAALCFVVSLTLVATPRRRPRLRWPALAGVTLGLGTLARPNGLLTALALGLALLLLPGFRRRRSSAALLLLGWLLVVAPWMVRNHALTGVANPITFYGPFNAWLGTNEQMIDMYRAGFSGDFHTHHAALWGSALDGHLEHLAAEGIFDPARIHAYWRDQVAEFIRREPLQALYLYAARFLHFWRACANPVTVSPAQFLASVLALVPLNLLALLGLARRPAARDPLLLWPLGLACLGSLPFVFSLRLRYPVYDPVLVLLASFALVELGIPWLRQMAPRLRWTASGGAPLLALLLALLLGAGACGCTARRGSAPPPSPPPATRRAVFLLAGQSNMLGMGRTADLPEELRVDPPGIQLVSFGRPIGLTRQITFGPELSFAHELAAAWPGREITLVKFAAAGTSLYAWAPEWSAAQARITWNDHEGSLYKKLVQYVRHSFLPRDAEFVGILWMQGERDAAYREAAEQYLDNLEAFVTALRAELGDPRIPFVLARISLPAAETPHASLVREAQQQAATRIPRTGLVDTDDLTRWPEDPLHYDTSGQIELGRRFARAVLELQ